MAKSAAFWTRKDVNAIFFHLSDDVVSAAGEKKQRKIQFRSLNVEASALSQRKPERKKHQQKQIFTGKHPKICGGIIK